MLSISYNEIFCSVNNTDTGTWVKEVQNWSFNKYEFNSCFKKGEKNGIETCSTNTETECIEWT